MVGRSRVARVCCRDGIGTCTRYLHKTAGVDGLRAHALLCSNMRREDSIGLAHHCGATGEPNGTVIPAHSTAPKQYEILSGDVRSTTRCHEAQAGAARAVMLQLEARAIVSTERHRSRIC